MTGTAREAASRLPVARLAAAFALLSALPLVLLTYFSLSLATDAVRREIETRMLSTAALSAERAHQELRGLAELVESYAHRPSLVEGLKRSHGRYDRAALRVHLRDLQQARPGIAVTFLARPDGTLIDIVPPTPSIVGKNFSFRDWYKGVTRTGRTYVSEAYRTQARSHALVTATATLVRVPGSRDKPVGILVAAYDLDHLHDLADEDAAVHDVGLKVTDQRGVLVATTGASLDQLVSGKGDPHVRAALRGGSGVTDLETPDGRRLSAYAPIPDFGWTVTASVPADAAFAAVGKLRSTVLAIAGLLGLVLLGGLALLIRALGGRRNAEEAVQRQASIRDAVLDATLDGIRMVDLDGKPLVSNRAFEELVASIPGLSLEGTPEERLARIAALTTDPDGFRAMMEKIGRDPQFVGQHEIEITEPSRSFQLYTAPVRDSEGTIGRMTVVRDVTAEREAESLKSELVSTVSHELRTPLASVLGFAELLRERELDAETRDRYVQTIYNEARRLTTLINDFLDLQRIEHGHFTLKLEPVELTELLHGQAELFTHQSSLHRLDLHFTGGPLNVLGERDRLAQVVGNLISNAIKYSPAGGSVRVSTARRNGAVRVAVSDEGVGIPAAEQRNLFTKFFRVDSSDTRKIGGTGLGLALVREIIEAHGGKVGFESTEGKGSTFWFDLPSVPQREGAHPSSRARVLVVEDDPAAAALLTEYLKMDGFEVEVVASGEEAIARAREEPPLLVCLDLVLDGIDGWEVLAGLKQDERTSQIPVVICTAHEGQERAGALGASDFLAKPFSGGQLRTALARVLPAKRGSVLVADDDPAVRRLVAETLRDEGAELREAADGEEALREIAIRMPDALVLDLAMPRVDGFDVLERLQQDPGTRALPVIVLTGTRLDARERTYLRERGVALLEKSSYSPVELRRLIRSALGEQTLDGVEQLERAEGLR
jgi:signal transduction histidine kinase/DNA-binding response OmpR family regulator